MTRKLGLMAATLLASGTLAYEHKDSLKEFMVAQGPDLMKTEIIEELVMGSMGPYLTLEELADLMDSLLADY